MFFITIVDFCNESNPLVGMISCDTDGLYNALRDAFGPHESYYDAWHREIEVSIMGETVLSVSFDL